MANLADLFDSAAARALDAQASALAVPVIEPHINADELREIWRSISPSCSSRHNGRTT